MDESSADFLNTLNRGFYEAHSTSFSQTRRSSWPGWQRVLDAVAGRRQAGKGLSLCDIACGNGRFESLAAASRPDMPWSFTLVDSNRQLLDEACRREELAPYEVTACRRDVLSGSGTLLAPGAFDAVVSFGFLHHIPRASARGDFLRACLDAVRPEGIAAFSFWRFADDASLAQRARASTERGRAQLGIALGEGDYLLGWQGDESRYRYCHSFGDAELDALVSELQPQGHLIDRFRADGRTGALNEYLVFAAEPAAHSV